MHEQRATGFTGYIPDQLSAMWYDATPLGSEDFAKNSAAEVEHTVAFEGNDGFGDETREDA
jgi:hypothetical protein